MFALHKQFSREKSLVYFCMWDRTDRQGYADFAGHVVQHNLFYLPAKEHKVSVYYNHDELQKLFVQIEERFRTETNIWHEIRQRLESEWQILHAYYRSEKILKTTEDFLRYFTSLTTWWSAMTVVFFIPDIKGINEEIRSKALAYREQGEKFTEISHKIIVDYWNTYAPKSFTDVFSVITPEELIAIIDGTIKNEEITQIRKRLNGYGMLDGHVYSLDELLSVLKANDIQLEESYADYPSASEVRGTTAYAGKVQGHVCRVIKKSDLEKVKTGDILIAEMTNPDYVPYIKIASAFVTDEGGMTCHASIVARELQKPCIVGTKIATKVFKDGDFVEVDAMNALVRKI